MYETKSEVALWDAAMLLLFGLTAIVLLPARTVMALVDAPASSTGTPTGHA